MKTQDPEQEISRRQAVVRKKTKADRVPPLTEEDGRVIDLYIAARRRQAAGAAAAETLKSAVLQIVSVRQQIARRGAIVRLDHSYGYEYSPTVTGLAKALSERREMERHNGTAKATVAATVAFEDVRRKDRERREASQLKAG